MCLYLKNDRPKTAKRDIVCFKLVRVRETCPRIWFSPFMGSLHMYDNVINAMRTFHDQEDELVEKLEVIPVGELDFTCLAYKNATEKIREGMHAYVRPFRRRLYRKKLKPGELRWKIAVIPKGTEYCYGLTPTGERSVVAVKMAVFRNVWSFLKYVINKRKLTR